MENPKFNVGDVITYKLPKDCPNGRYKYGGEYPEESLQKIISYMEYYKDRNCWKIDVEHSTGNYYMLEDEFLEYDFAPKDLSNYSIF